MMMDMDDLPDGDEHDDSDSAPTRIIGMPGSEDSATRIVQPPPGGVRAPERGQGAVIGVSGKRAAQSPASAEADDDRTVVIPSTPKPPAGQKSKDATTSGPRVGDAQPAKGAAGDGSASATALPFDPAVAWLVITDGPGRGQHLNVYYGQNTIGRGAEQRIRLNFGDNRIAREAHAFVVYDDVERKFYLRDNGKANLVRVNGKPVLTPTELADRDQLSIGETQMTFVAFCGPAFDWLAQDDGPDTASSSA